MGFTNLAWTIVASVACLKGFATLVLGFLVLISGIYAIQAAVLDLLEILQIKTHLITSEAPNMMFTNDLFWFGVDIKMS